MAKNYFILINRNYLRSRQGNHVPFSKMAAAEVAPKKPTKPTCVPSPLPLFSDPVSHILLPSYLMHYLQCRWYFWDSGVWACSRIAGHCVRLVGRSPARVWSFHRWQGVAFLGIVFYSFIFGGEWAKSLDSCPCVILSSHFFPFC